MIVNELWRRAAMFLRARQFRQEMDEELQSHLAMKEADLRAAGMEEKQTRRAAQMKVGNALILRECSEDAWGWTAFEALLQDLRYALRLLHKSPVFTATAMLTLALGIGANTAIFSLWNGVLRSSLPMVYQPAQLVMLSNPDTAGFWHGNAAGDRDWLTYAEFEQLRDHLQGVSGLMASESALDNWQVRFARGEWEEAQGRLVSSGYFRVLGVNAALGRMFTVNNDGADAAHAVISYSYWQRRFGGRPDVLGQTFTVRNAVLTIIGVTPRGFIGETASQQPDLWMPLHLQPSVLPGENWLHDVFPDKVMWLHVFGRLKPGVTPTRVEAEANAIFKADLPSFYGAVPSPQRRRTLLDQRLKVRAGARGASEMRSDFSASLTALLAAVGLLLLIACTNLANLLLARGTARHAEISLRLSLGASRGRLMRQFITESLVLAGMGALGGLAVAYLIHAALVRMMVQANDGVRMDFALNPLVLVFTLTVTALAAMLFGLLPAWQVTKADAGAGLKEQSRSATSGVGRMHWRRFLTGLQLALSVPLLVGAGLLVRTVYNLHHVELGFPAERLLLVGINSRAAGYNSEQSTTLFHDLRAEIQRIPGVKAVSFSQNGVFSGGRSSVSVNVDGYVSKLEEVSSLAEMVGPGYFSTLGIPMIMGREIGEGDRVGAPHVCVINEAFAKQFFARRNPLGAHIRSMDGATRMIYQVVGVAGNARTQTLRRDVKPTIYIPTTQPTGDDVKRASFLIRTATATGPVLASVQAAFHRLNAALPIGYAHSMEQQIAPLLVQDQTTAQLALVFGCVALTLAAVGLYGVLSYGIARRTGEIAIRIALGAQRGRVVAMILGETLWLVIAGLLAGMVGAYGASRLLTSRLYGVPPEDPLTLSLAMGLLLLVAFTAAYLPARQASQLDPMTALRQE